MDPNNNCKYTTILLPINSLKEKLEANLQPDMTLICIVSLMNYFQASLQTDDSPVASGSDELKLHFVLTSFRPFLLWNNRHQLLLLTFCKINEKHVCLAAVWECVASAAAAALQTFHSFILEKD